ncbi:hypothetical protein H2248_011900 [Termitomyces sp. 'cryptogamus']|nr:hypothetical protein H2248_011900 [Termitomyces sp. 'cryptogamus']
MQFQDRYDDPLDAKECAAGRHKLDYARWKRVKEWIYDERMQTEENSDKENKEGMNEEEKKRRLRNLG